MRIEFESENGARVIPAQAIAARIAFGQIGLMYGDLRRKVRWKFLKKTLSVFLGILCMVHGFVLSAHAETRYSYSDMSDTAQQGDTHTGAAILQYRNPGTGYTAVIEDEAGLFTLEVRESLLQEMKAVTEYGNAGLKTILHNPYRDAVDYNEACFDALFGETADGCLFLIDMDTRELVLTSEGAVKKAVPKSIADSIADNVYKSASDGEYGVCAQKAFSQVLRRLEGHRIAQPMKYICNALLATTAAILLNYLLWRLLTVGYGEKKLRKTARKRVAEAEKAAGTLLIKDVRMLSVEENARELRARAVPADANRNPAGSAYNSSKSQERSHSSGSGNYGSSNRGSSYHSSSGYRSSGGSSGRSSFGSRSSGSHSSGRHRF